MDTPGKANSPNYSQIICWPASTLSLLRSAFDLMCGKILRRQFLSRDASKWTKCVLVKKILIYRDKFFVYNYNVIVDMLLVMMEN